DEDGVTWVTDAWLVVNRTVSKFWPPHYRRMKSKLRPGEPALRSMERPAASQRGPDHKLWNRLDDADAILAGDESKERDSGKGFAADRRRKLLYQQAKQFLLDTLKNGPVLSTEVIRRAAEVDICRTVLDKFKRKLRIKDHPAGKVGRGSSARYWCLPGQK